MYDAGHILIVDGDEGSSRSLKLILNETGYQAETASTGREALEKGQATPFNLALVDLSLPDMEATQLLESLKELHPAMAFMVLNGRASVTNAPRIFNNSTSAYLSKPVDMDEVLARIEDLLERQRLIRDKARAETQRDATLEMLHQRNSQLELLSEAARAFSSSLDLDQVLMSVLDETRRLLGAIGVSVWLADPLPKDGNSKPGELVCRQAVGHGSDLIRGWRLAPGQGIAGWVAGSGQGLIVPDSHADERYFDGVEKATGTHLRSVLNVPLRISLRGSSANVVPNSGYHSQVLGVIQVVDTQVDRFDLADLKLLESLAASAAVAIHNAWLYEQAQAEIAERVRVEQALRESEQQYRLTMSEVRLRHRELALLNRIIAASAADLEPASFLETTCRELAQAFEVPRVTATLLSEDKTQACIMAEYRANGGLPGPDAHGSAVGTTIPIAGNSAYQYLLTYKAPFTAPNSQPDPESRSGDALMSETGLDSFLIIPLLVSGEVAGSLLLEALAPRRFSAAEVSLAWSVADQVSGALARAQLAETHRRLIVAIEQAHESVAILDVQGIILYVNPAFERITGYSQAEVVGGRLDMLRSGQHEPAFYEDLWATVRSGQVWHGRIVNKKKDGSLYTDETTITPVRNESGAIVNFVEIKRDVTRELELEQQYRQAQKMEAVGRLTAGIAHDFNNLLTAINGFAELVQFRLSPDDPAQELVSKVRDSGRHAVSLVQQLLAFSSRQIVEPQVLDLNRAVKAMEKILRRIIGEDVVLETCLAHDLWPVKLGRVQIEQVILNLAVNARDAMPTGGRLAIETANVVLDEAYAASQVEVEPGEYVLLRVSDTGVGMSQQVQAHLFEPFFTTKERGKGTGLGLATVYGIVAQSGGHIRVESEPGAGSIFTIYLPRCREPLPAPSEPGVERVVPDGVETVLVVEDDAPMRELAHLVLKQQGYTVLEAEDGPGALRLAADHAGPIHVLLTDVIMPRMCGQALAQQLAGLCPGLRVVYMSGYPDDEIAQYGELEADAAILHKPFSPMDLARKVRAVLDQA
jgi:PAS domain S-box-containing protein